MTATRRTKSEWEEVLTKMIEKGATGSEEDFKRVTTTLGLSTKDADAIVAYRKANGSFQDFDLQGHFWDLAHAGYAIAVFNVRGTGNSGGCFFSSSCVRWLRVSAR